MSLLAQGTVASDGCIFREQFFDRKMIVDQAGAIVACNVDRGISPTGTSGRVTYERTTGLLINATQMTIRAKFRTGATFPVDKSLIAKIPTATNDNQWAVHTFGALTLGIYVSASAADLANLSYMNVALVANTDYVYHVVYNGALAAGSRIVHYSQGAAVANTIVGTIPAQMRASASPVSVFNFSGGANKAPPTDFLLFDFAIWNRAFSAQECLDDARDTTFT